MTVSESRDRLRNRYIDWYTKDCINSNDKMQMIHDAKYTVGGKERKIANSGVIQKEHMYQ